MLGKLASIAVPFGAALMSSTVLASTAANAEEVPARAAPDAAVIAKQWGVLARSAETIWTEGQDQALAINWAVVGQRLELRRFGLWGREQITVEPDASGVLRAKVVMPDGAQRDAVLAVTKSGYTIFANGEREVCQLAQATITCKLEVEVGKKWTLDRVWTWTISSTAAVEKLLRELPGVFPERSPGSFDKSRGVAVESADRIYRGQNGGMGVSILDGDGQSPDRLKYFSFDPDGMPIDYRSFKRDDGGQFLAAIPTPTGERTALVTYVGLGVGARGQTRIYNLDGSRISISTSIDGSMILRENEIKVGNGWRRKSYDITSEPKKYQNDFTERFFKAFSGKIFRSYYSSGWENFVIIENFGENIFKISQYGGTSSTANYTQTQDIFNLSNQCFVFFKSGGLFKQECLHKSGVKLQKESMSYGNHVRIDSNGKAYVFRNAGNRIEIEEYMIQSDGSLKDNDQIYIQDYFASFASEVRYADLRRLQYELRMGYVEDRAREEAERQAFFAGLSAMTRNLGVDTSNPSALLRPTTLAEWAARSPSASTTRGGMGDMGGISRTEAPRMTPQQQAQFNELERIKMREQIARGERPTTIAEDAQARMAGHASGTGSQVASGETRKQSSTTGSSSRSSEAKAPDMYAYCWAVRAALVPKVGTQANRTLAVVDADRAVSTRFVSQIGRVNSGRLASGQNWSMVMADWSREFLSVAPQLNGSWYITQPGDAGCRMADSWDEMSETLDTDNRLWRNSRQSTARARDEVSIQPVMWSPSN